MAFTKITNTELNSRGATTLPNQPTISAAALKQEFDAPAKEIVAPHFNGLIDELEADTAGASIGLQAPARRTGSTVKAVVDAISQDLVTVEGKLNGVTNAGLLDAISLKHGHENKALLDTYDQTNEDIEDAVNQKHSHSNKSVIDKWSESEGGAPLYNGQSMTGDMYSSEYDPDSTVKNAGGIKTYVTNGLGTKVDKVDGKGLSTNDYSNTDKNKVDNLGTAAYKNSTSVVKDSTDLVESGAVYSALQNDLKNTDAVVESTVGWTGKNHCQNTATTLETAGMKYTVNADGTVDLSGTPTSNVILEINKHIPIPSGIKKLRLSGLQDTVNIVWHRLQLLDASDNVVYNIISGGNTNYDYVVDVSAYPTAQYIDMEVKRSENNVTVSGTIKPMVMDASIIDTTFKPYHATVDATKADNSVIGTVEGANASKAWSVGEHFIKDGAFKEVTQPISSGGAISSSNTVDKPIADLLDEIEGTVTPSQGITLPIANNRLVRRGNRVSLNLRLVDVNFPTAGTAVIVGTVPDGFQPKPWNTFYCAAITDDVKPLRAYIGSSRNIGITSAEVLTDITISLSIVYYID